MVWLILSMVLCVVLGGAVVGVVAVPARRDGKQVLTPRGEQVVAGVARRTDKVVEGAKDATGTVVGSARSKVSASPQRTETGE
ncbi:hypothetical protein PZ938_19810 [Luteipulveratus sp. YIM 133132]|uniref:Secreted protein n=1 Tax=Luteipulveratus flavus TaxID=3031728 RepID=A0ABT6C4C3_9MICO|nr:MULTISPECIES: hypothetical protein [unclassified Luteipulveratus]MDE9367869.1 hypothetical protein [Luteipulveratus sp. YIM 133132]MDF8263794.1 hypothetical protein [Luteipulveratus sp. YIM 133296]